jgi:hypothetical protein
MKTNHFLIALGLFLSCATLGRAQTVTLKLVTRFDYPGIAATLAMGINDAGDIVGYFTDEPGTGRGFSGYIRFAGGTFSPPIVYPGAYQTVLTGINNNGTTVGYYSTESPVATHSFFLNGDTYTIYDYPGAYDTRVVGINDAGDIVGTYILTDNSQGSFAVVGGVLQAITVPDSTYVSSSDINNRGDIVGWYNTPDASLGFRLESNGTLRYPIKPGDAEACLLFGANDRRANVGVFYDGTFSHGLYFAGGQLFATYDLPGTDNNNLTGINRGGWICGWGFLGSDAHSYILRSRIDPAE